MSAAMEKAVTASSICPIMRLLSSEKKAIWVALDSNTSNVRPSFLVRLYDFSPADRMVIASFIKNHEKSIKRINGTILGLSGTSERLSAREVLTVEIRLEGLLDLFRTRELRPPPFQRRDYARIVLAKPALLRQETGLGLKRIAEIRR
jgi:hypothetical protein